MINEMLQNPVFKRGFDIGFSYRLAADEFDEELHPRDERGQFTSGGAVDRPLKDDTQILKEAKGLAEMLDKTPYGKDEHGSKRGQAVYKELGFDGKPQLVSKDEWKEITKDSPILYRGVESTEDKSARSMVNEFKNGTMYVGEGMFGNGTYTTHDKNVANEYKGEKGAVMQMCLSKDAKVADYAQMYDESQRFAQDPKNNFTREQRHAIGDACYYAALRGYDALKMDKYCGSHNNHTIILNRTKVIMPK